MKRSRSASNESTAAIAASASAEADILDLKKWIDDDPRAHAILQDRANYDRDRFRHARVAILYKLTMPIAERLAVSRHAWERHGAERALYANRIGLMTGIAKTISDSAIHDSAIEMIIELSLVKMDVEQASWLLSQVKSSAIATRISQAHGLRHSTASDIVEIEADLFS